jgi:excisionase family DNA binding protein
MSDTSKLVEQVKELATHALARVQRGDAILPRLLDIDDAARYLAVSDKAIRELIQRGELPYLQRIRGRSPYLVDVKDLDSWVLKNKIRAGE